MAFSDSPEVCFLGRSNVGKSSLLNAVMCQKLAHMSSKPGRTKEMNAFAVRDSPNNGNNRLVVLDMPGYGAKAPEEWGKQIMKYLSSRKQLKRAFLLVDASHGVMENDRLLWNWLKEAEVPFQIILTKVDSIIQGKSNRTPSETVAQVRLAELRAVMEDIKQELDVASEEDGVAIGEVIACSSKKWIRGKRMGIDAVRFAILQAVGLELRPKVKLAKPVEIVSHEEIFGREHAS